MTKLQKMQDVLYLKLFISHQYEKRAKLLLTQLVTVADTCGFQFCVHPDVRLLAN